MLKRFLIILFIGLALRGIAQGYVQSNSGHTVQSGGTQISGQGTCPSTSRNDEVHLTLADGSRIICYYR